MIAGVGLDLVDVARIERLLQRHPSRFPERCFVDGEVRRPKDVEHLAGLIAAKEAGYKALHRQDDPLFGWREIAVRHAGSGAPRLEYLGRAADAAAERRIARAHLSITHHGGFAAAVVVLEIDP